ncbi:MAG: mannose-6-phosphate isomerase, class I [Rhodoglobus sp.]
MSNIVLGGQPVFVGIANTPRGYAWGSRGAISALLGVTPTGAPEAELWLGAHPGSPSRILDPSQTGGHTDLVSWIAADPEHALGSRAGSGRLPFLLKVLAAASPLSLQAHPTAQQAIAGFAREHANGTELDAPHRNYRDAYPKPELIYALEDGFEALCGFRPAVEVRELVQRLIELDVDENQADDPLHSWLNLTGSDETIRAAFEWLISKNQTVGELIARVVSIARANIEEFPTVVLLADAYPGDPGIVISLMLNRVTLRKGEVLYLPAGNIHAYLRGLGVELMTSSDNVMRGGLTPKHVDVPELLRVLDFRPVPVPYEAGSVEGDSVLAFHPADVDFELDVVTGSGAAHIDQAAIILCTDGAFTVTGATASQAVTAGQSYYVTPNEGELAFAGAGRLFVATSR